MGTSSERERQHTLETRVPLSRSLLWRCQQHYFDTRGPAAWAGDVPFFITNSVTLAASYAELIARLIQDYARAGRINPAEPLYILELGAGSGQLAFRFLTWFEHYRNALGLTDISCRYILTDNVPANVAFWRSHPMLSSHIAAGTLDIAHYDLTQPQPIRLEHQAVTLGGHSLSNPLIVIANYVFDSIPADLFYVDNGSVSQRLITLSATAPAKETHPDTPPQWPDPETLDITFDDLPFTPADHPDPFIRTLLSDYARHVDKSAVLIPDRAFQALHHLRSLSRQGCVTLCADKGYTTYDELNYESDFPITFHGSFSLMVNFHALTEYARTSGGDALISSYGNHGLKVGLLLLDRQPPELTETRLAFTEHFSRFGPQGLMTLKTLAETRAESWTMEEILAVLKLSAWDPDFLHSMSAALRQKLLTATPREKQVLITGLAEAAAHIYPIPNGANHFFELASLYYELNHLPRALHYYDLSRRFFGETAALCFNIALCHYKSGNHKDAAAYFNKAHHLNPDHPAITQWYQTLSY